MPVASSRYWNEIHAKVRATESKDEDEISSLPSAAEARPKVNGKAEDIEHDEEGKQVLRVLGRNMAFLVKSIAMGKEQMGLPEKEQRISTNFIR